MTQHTCHMLCRCTLQAKLFSRTLTLDDTLTEIHKHNNGTMPLSPDHISMFLYKNDTPTFITTLTVYTFYNTTSKTDTPTLSTTHKCLARQSETWVCFGFFFDSINDMRTVLRATSNFRQFSKSSSACCNTWTVNKINTPTITTLQNRTRGNAQYDGRPPLYYRFQTRGNMHKFSLPWELESLGRKFEWYNTLSDPKNTHFGTRIWQLSPIQAEL